MFYCHIIVKLCPIIIWRAFSYVLETPWSHAKNNLCIFMKLQKKEKWTGNPFFFLLLGKVDRTFHSRMDSGILPDMKVFLN